METAWEIRASKHDPVGDEMAHKARISPTTLSAVMDWQRFIGDGVGAEGLGVGARKSHHSLLMETVREAVETNTLANWVRETNYRLSSGRQLTLRMFA